MNEDEPARALPPICGDCGHRASLHHHEGCRALLLGRGRPLTCGCKTTLRDILSPRLGRPPAELLERRVL